MARPTAASLKRVSAENLQGLGAERLAEILVEASASHPALKRRLRMELAAVQGGDHLAVEIDKRLDSHATSRSRVHWRQRSGFVADLDGLLSLIVERLGALDREGALERLLRFMDVARRLNMRMSDRNGTLDAVFRRAAGELGASLRPSDGPDRLADSLAANPAGWTAWLPALIERAPPEVIVQAKAALQAKGSAQPGVALLTRHLADATGDIETFVRTFAPEALRHPAVAAQVARRLLEAGRLDEAGDFLEAAKPKPSPLRGLLRVRPEVDFDWESVWIDWLDAAGRGAEAQGARWASFERTLSAARARDFAKRLPDFDDVEAEHRAFAHATAHADATLALRFLMDYPGLLEAARLIEGRSDDLALDTEEAEAWAAKLTARFPAAAERLLREAAAAAFRRREYKTSKRLTAAADALAV
jgi:hypothetical protein